MGPLERSQQSGWFLVSAQENTLFLGLVKWSGMHGSFPPVALAPAVPSSTLLELLGFPGRSSLSHCEVCGCLLWVWAGRQGTDAKSYSHYLPNHLFMNMCGPALWSVYRYFNFLLTCSVEDPISSCIYFFFSSSLWTGIFCLTIW